MAESCKYRVSFGRQYAAFDRDAELMATASRLTHKSDTQSADFCVKKVVRIVDQTAQPGAAGADDLVGGSALPTLMVPRTGDAGSGLDKETSRPSNAVSCS